MSKPSSGHYIGTSGHRKPTAPIAPKRPTERPQSVPASGIRFSQTSVNGSQEIIDSMKRDGWRGDPIDVVTMDDGGMTTLDNTRVVAARAAGIDVQAIVHSYDEPLPDAETVQRFTTKKGVPRTWGEAVELRIGKQSGRFRRNHPKGSYTIDKVR